jgi:hypothetical protein
VTSFAEKYRDLLVEVTCPELVCAFNPYFESGASTSSAIPACVAGISEALVFQGDYRRGT